MKNITNVCFVILATLCLQQINKVESKDLISVACSIALHKKDCESSLRSQPESKSADLIGLAKIALKLAEANANRVTSQFSQKLKKESNKYVKEELTDCLEAYQTALEKIEDSIDALASKRFSDASTWVSAAMTEVESCKSALSSNKAFTRYCSNVLAVTNKAAGN
ncbi:hypothetical protein UlMin_036318 [Ulmus minor]